MHDVLDCKRLSVVDGGSQSTQRTTKSLQIFLASAIDRARLCNEHTRHIFSRRLSSPVHTTNNVEATLSNATSGTILLTQQSRMLRRHCCRFWQQHRTKFRPFDKVETTETEHVQFVSTFLEGRNFVRHCCLCNIRSNIRLCRKDDYYLPHSYSI